MVQRPRLDRPAAASGLPYAEPVVTGGSLERIEWDSGSWTNPPVTVRESKGNLVVTAAEGSDAWRHTSYGFVHDNEHALVKSLPVGRAVEVTFGAGLSEQFDQAGVFLSVDETTWVKAGVEYSDGTLQLGAVVTLGRSDWSVRPVPEWSRRDVTVRLSRAEESVTVRVRVDDNPFELVRVAPTPPNAPAAAGPYVCAPTRAGLTVTFRSWVETPADDSLH